LVLAVAVSHAAAETLVVTNHDYGFRATWTSLEVETSVGRVRCPITMEGSFVSEDIPTVARSAMAKVTNAGLLGSSCTGGSASIRVETLPWTFQYNGFTGVLPNIVSVRRRLVNAGLTALIAGVTCRLRTTDVEPLNLSANVSRDEVASVEIEPLAGIRIEGGGFCPFAGTAHIQGRTGPLATRLGQQTVHVMQGPAPPYYVVSVGDSFISGEAGRWAGNTTAGPPGRMDRDGRTAYWDNDNRTAELIPGCHREIYSAPIRIGTRGGPRDRNFACSGAITRTMTSTGQFKPGLDFPAGGGAS
jgi:hypothetical protein